MRTIHPPVFVSSHDVVFHARGWLAILVAIYSHLRAYLSIRALMLVIFSRCDNHLSRQALHYRMDAVVQGLVTGVLDQLAPHWPGVPLW